MKQNEKYEQYEQIIDVLASGSLEQLESLAEQIEDFPHGTDDFIDRYWIINAIDCGSKLSVEWMLSKGVNLDFTDDEGVTPLSSAIDRENPDRYEIIELLIKHGVPINRKGFNDWTPLHQAAAREDIKALELLVKRGADLSVRTDIDDYATPL
jgi:ankyrin repeat protein